MSRRTCKQNKRMFGNSYGERFDPNRYDHLLEQKGTLEYWDEESRLWIPMVPIEEVIEQVNREYEEDVIRQRTFYDINELTMYADRKKDWHKNKGKRRIKDGYKERYV